MRYVLSRESYLFSRTGRAGHDFYSHADFETFDFRKDTSSSFAKRVRESGNTRFKIMPDVSTTYFHVELHSRTSSVQSVRAFERSRMWLLQNRNNDSRDT